MTLRNIGLFIVSLVVCCLFSACSETDSIEGKQDTSDTAPTVTVIFGFGGLGDRSYNDVIYDGLWSSKVKYGESRLHLDTYCPSNMEEVEKIMTEWFANRSSRRELLVLCSPVYDEFFDKHPEWKSEKDAEIFFLDSNRSDLDLYTWYLSLYGVSHFAGQMIKQFGADSLAVVLANDKDNTILEAADGFAHGFYNAGGNISADDVYYLSQESGQGYASADSLYHLAFTLDRKGYDFVVPVAGGTAQGLYRYTRMNSPLNKKGMFLTCGYDIDQQEYSNKIVFSVIKRVDLAVSEFIDGWINEETQEKHRYLGLDSKYVDVKVANAYEQTDSVEEAKRNALKKISIEAEQKYKAEHEKDL